jgi:hypothetical protein
MHEFLLSHLALRDKYLTEQILKLLTSLLRRHQSTFIKYNALSKFKHIFSRVGKPHLTAVPKMLTAEAEAEAL